MTHNPTWHDRAACQGALDWRDFVGDSSPIWAAAARVIGTYCRTCPVVGQCRADIASRPLHYRHGVWGGELWIGGREPRQWPDGLCDTIGGYLRHLREGTVPCAQCQSRYEHRLARSRARHRSAP